MILPATVLLVDTDGPLRTLYYRLLKSEGYEVLLADSGHDAIKTMIRTPPDVIVLEWILRDWGSVEVLHQAIAQPTRIPVIINTRYQPAQREYFAYLADRFLIKSLDISPLLRAVRDCLPEHLRGKGGRPADPSPSNEDIQPVVGSMTES